MTAPSDGDIRQILIDRIEKHKCHIGLVVAVLDPGGSRIISCGTRARDDRRPLDGGTVFNVTCVIKLFTVLLLCDMVRRGEAELTEPVSACVPDGFPIPTRQGTPITLLDLATHTSGLPAAMRATSLDRTMHTVYASHEHMCRSLACYRMPPASTRATYTYSTLGMQLLAYALSCRAGADYESLLHSRICAPLGLTSTGVTPSGDMSDRMATGHNERLLPVSAHETALPGGSYLLSSAHDLIVFLRAHLHAHLNGGASPLSPAMADMLSVRRPSHSRDVSVALGWHVLDREGTDIVWHHGLGRGHRAFLGFRVDSGAGVIVLSNASTNAGVHDIGYHLLDRSYPLHAPDSRLLLMPEPYAEAAIDREIYDHYVGRYQLTPARLLTIARDGDTLLAQWTGQRSHEIVPMTERTFFYNSDGPDITPYTTLTFERGDNGGGAGAVVVHNLTRDLRLLRVESEPQPMWFGRRPIDAMPRTAAYVGTYLIGDAAVTIAVDHDRLYLQEPGGPTIELLPYAPDSFFYKSDTLDAQIVFEVGGDGRANGLVLRSHELSEHGVRCD